MSKHTIVLTVELDDSGDGDKETALMAIAEGAVRNAKEDYQRESDDPDDNPRHDGYEGPFVTDIEGVVSDLREMVQTALNSGSGDTQWATLVDLGGILGLEYDEERDTYQ